MTSKLVAMGTRWLKCPSGDSDQESGSFQRMENGAPYEVCEMSLPQTLTTQMHTVVPPCDLPVFGAQLRSDNMNLGAMVGSWSSP